jgi:hypothetical protein
MLPQEWMVVMVVMVGVGSGSGVFLCAVRAKMFMSWNNK